MKFPRYDLLNLKLNKNICKALKNFKIVLYKVGYVLRWAALHKIEIFASLVNILDIRRLLVNTITLLGGVLWRT